MTTKIKVLQVIPKLGYGGAETGCYDLAHYLAEKGCNSFIATSGGKLLKFIKKNKVKILRLPVHSKNPFLIMGTDCFLKKSGNMIRRGVLLSVDNWMVSGEKPSLQRGLPILQGVSPKKKEKCRRGIRKIK